MDQRDGAATILTTSVITWRGDPAKAAEYQPHLARTISGEPRERQSPDWRFALRHSGEWRSREASLRYFLSFFLPRALLAARSSITACAAASRAIGTRN